MPKATEQGYSLKMVLWAVAEPPHRCDAMRGCRCGIVNSRKGAPYYYVPLGARRVVRAARQDAEEIQSTHRFSLFIIMRQMVRSMSPNDFLDVVLFH
eukprot:SAG31_NODE_464_length_15318_cov_17.930876_2_plen_97_part_00